VTARKIESIDTSTPAITLAVGACFFATGAAGLIYEIAWNRMLALAMGNTSYALATLLTVFMGGLALGAWIGGKRAPAGRGALRLYGVLELGVGLYCLLLPLLLDLADPLFAAIYRNHYSSLVRFNLLQFVVVAVLLIVPTTLMGATLPILTRFVVPRLGVMSRTVGVLYAVNSGGAFAGAMLAGLVLLPAVGVQSSYRIAAAVNIVVGFIALTLSSVVAESGAAEVSPRKGRPRSRKEQVPSDARPTALTPTILLVGFGVSGFAAMVYQVAWTRAVTLAIGSSTYAFTLIAGAFILGLTLGSLALGRMGDRNWGPYALAILPAVIGLSAVVTVAALGTLPIRVSRVVISAESFAGQQWTQFGQIFSIFVVPTFCMGGMLPIVSRYLARRRDDAGRAVGTAYAANAAGTILGSFCGGFVLIPWIGMRSSILLGAVLSGAVGAAFLYRALPPTTASRGVKAALILVAVVLAAALAPGWERSVMTSGPFLRARAYVTDESSSAEAIRERMASRILYYREGVATVVTVTEAEDGRRSLIVGGKPDAFSFASTQNWLGHLPMLLRPDARRVLIIGLGSGHTLGSVASHPGVESIDSVELSEGVVHAAKEYFDEFTGGVLDDPRSTVIVGDGRLHLEHSDRNYDVIVSQPSNPWIAGASSLFTREAFSTMKRRLEPGGLACIWFQGFRMPVENFRSLSRTWAEVWKHPSIWESRLSGEYLFVGSDEPLRIDFDRLREAFENPAVREQMTAIRIPSPAHALGYLVIADDEVRAIAGDAVVNTDDGSRIEYDTPKGMWRDHATEIMKLIGARRVDPWNFVTTAHPDAEEFRANRAAGERILRDRARSLEALDLPRDQAIAVLEEIVEANPYDATAGRALRRLRRGQRP